MKTKLIAYTGAVAALYAALTMALAPISYGAVQFRISEVLCVLPFFFPWSAWGLVAGCAIADLISSYGIIDVVFGSAATLLSSLTVAFLGRRGGVGAKILACLAPVIFNGVIIGGVISFMTVKSGFLSGLVLNGLTVALGEAAVMFVLGLPLLLVLPRTAAYKYLVNNDLTGKR